MLNITVDKIAAFNPCENRFSNFKKHYPFFSGSVENFLSLDNITHQDKVWVCVRMMSRNQRFYWARACALSVLEIFEAKYPDDKRVRELLDFLGTIPDVTKMSEVELTKLRILRSAAAAASAAYAAAYAAAADAAYSAAAAYAAYSADAAYSAAADAAYSAAAYAAAADAAYSAAAAYAAYSDAAAARAAYSADADKAGARQAQEELNLILLNQIMEMNI